MGKRKCTNSDCPYRSWGDASFAYDQDDVRWSEGRPAHNGQCLNCIDDQNYEVDQ